MHIQKFMQELNSKGRAQESDMQQPYLQIYLLGNLYTNPKP